MKSLRFITFNEKQNCSGCTTCESICPANAIVMKYDEEGFLYPHIDSNKCLKCNLCDKVCPQKQSNAPYEKNVFKVFGVKNLEEKELNTSSSGGLFSILGNKAVDNNGVVYGVKYSNNWNAVHDSASSKEAIKEFKGSKYLQSDIRYQFKKVKQDLILGKTVLFTGTPCQIHGLKQFLSKDYENLITVDLICHGVPSPKVFRDYIAYIEKKYRNHVAMINMKDKTNGWGHQSLRIYFTDGTSMFGKADSDLWNTIYYSYQVLRPSCYNCNYSNYHRVGDISIGDFWGVEKAIPNFYDSRGVSLVFVNTQKGNTFFNKCKNDMSVIETDTNHCDKGQHNLERCAPISLEREVFWKVYNLFGFRFAKYCFWDGKHLLARIVKKLLK